MSRLAEIGAPSEANNFDYRSRGRGEVLRLFLEVRAKVTGLKLTLLIVLTQDAGIAFKDYRYSFDDYNAQVKSGEITKLKYVHVITMPVAGDLTPISSLKSLPVIEINSAKYSQTYSLLRLWARQLGKYDGKTDLERYYVDAIADIASDWRSKFVDSAFRASDNGFGPKGDQKELDYHKSFTVPKFASALNAHLSTNPLSAGGPFVLGKEVTYADFVIFQIAHDDDWAGLDNNPRLKELVEAVKARPRVA
ncbi:hypothetical protein FRC10_006215 [Ceratobasidium sp. 414]|nr:hypothetical protein FRC10_006215 [Ceratobasidium sp. 414]